MTYIKQAIQKAIEGGWEKERFEGFFVDKNQKPTHKNAIVLSTDRVGLGYEVNLNDIFLAPLFWESLGKVLGWDIMPPAKIIMYQYDGIAIDIKWNEMTVWHAQMHRFIDHLAEGKDIESFFETLLSNQK